MMEAKIEGSKIRVAFKYDPILVSKIKTIPGRKYDPTTRTWLVPNNSYSRNILREFGFDVPEENIRVPKLPEYLRPFQKEGVKKMFEWDGKILLADEMGLGKTVQSLTYLWLSKSLPAIIVCPASLKWNWAAEIRKWLKVNSVVISGGKIYSLPKAPFYIINYDIFHKWSDILSQLNPRAIVLDECHYIKNPNARRTKAIINFAKRIKRIIALTGTPVVNRPIEMYNVIKLLNPSLFPSRWKFAQRYCDLHHNGFGWVMDGSSNEEELHRILVNTLMLRRTKEDVLNELPPKIRTILPVDFVNKKYERTIEKIRRILRFNEEGKPRVTANILAEIAFARQIIGESKVNAVIEWVENYLEENPAKKVVIFGWHRIVLEKLFSHFKQTAVIITGEIESKARQLAVEKFQNDPSTRVFIGSIRAAGVGITLTAADTVVFAELGWTPSEHDQAEDRIHRIGQKSVANIYYIVARGTIDEVLMGIIDKKRKIVNKIVDGKETSSDTILTELLTKIVSGK